MLMKNLINLRMSDICIGLNSAAILLLAIKLSWFVIAPLALLVFTIRRSSRLMKEIKKNV